MTWLRREYSNNNQFPPPPYKSSGIFAILFHSLFIQNKLILIFSPSSPSRLLTKTRPLLYISNMYRLCYNIGSHTIQTVQWCHLATRLESDFSSSLSTRRSCCSRDRASFQAVWPKAMKSLSTGWEHDNSQSQTDTSQQTWHSVNKQYGQTVWTNSKNQQYEHPQFNNKLISRHNNYEELITHTFQTNKTKK